MIDSAIIAHDLFVRPLSTPEKEHYYEDSKKLAALFGIGPPLILASLVEFNAYMDVMIESHAFTVGPLAKELARDILHPRPWFLKPTGPLFRLVTAGLLPEKLREEYQLDWSERKRAVFSRAAALIRTLVPWLPARLRIVPQARRAERSRR